MNETTGKAIVMFFASRAKKEDYERYFNIETLHPEDHVRYDAFEKRGRVKLEGEPNFRYVRKYKSNEEAKMAYGLDMLKALKKAEWEITAIINDLK
jgi:hypothetical protein